MRTALPVDRAAFALPAGTQLLLPLNRCQPPVFAEVDGVAAWLTLGVDVVDGVLCGIPALGPPDPVGPLLLNVRVPLVGFAAERVIAWRCWSKDTWAAELVEAARLE